MAFRDDLFLLSDRFAQWVDGVLAESGCEESNDEDSDDVNISDEEPNVPCSPNIPSCSSATPRPTLELNLTHEYDDDEFASVLGSENENEKEVPDLPVVHVQKKTAREPLSRQVSSCSSANLELNHERPGDLSSVLVSVNTNVQVPNPRSNNAPVVRRRVRVPKVPARKLLGRPVPSCSSANLLLNHTPVDELPSVGDRETNVNVEIPNPRRNNLPVVRRPRRIRKPKVPARKPQGRPTAGPNPKQKRKRKEKPKPWDWFEGANEVESIPFTGNHGINPVIARQLREKNSELDVLDQFLGADFWQQVCDETNKQAHSYLEEDDEGKPKVKWVDLTLDELKAYFALVILMAQNVKANINDNWSTRRVLHQPIFGETMARDRFKTISRFLHFSSSVERNDKLRKIRPIIDKFISAYKKVYTPQKEICVDESLIKFRGRLSYIQFNPSKRARFGIKIYKLNYSKTGYCYNFKIYTGKELGLVHEEEKENNPHNDGNPDNVENPQLFVENPVNRPTENPVNRPTENPVNAGNPKETFLLSEKIVLELCADLLNEGRIMYLDNWYSSPKLFLELLNQGTYAVGVVRSERTNFPVELRKKELEIGELSFMHTKKILALKWKDRKDLAMLSTLHSRPEYEEVIPQREKRRPNPVPQLKPNVVMNYNYNMNGVDKQDQRLSCFPVMRKCVKGYKKLFFYLFDVTLNNARVIHEIVTKKKTTMSKFRINLAEQILERVDLSFRPVGGRPSTSGESPLRLQARFWGHFIRKINATSKQRPSRRCRVCTAQGRRSETVYECNKCLVPLHLETCFELFHTQKNL